MLASQPPPHRLNAPTVYTRVVHTGQKIIHAVKFMRPSKEPPRMTTVMAANTNWKNMRVAIGKVRAGMPDAAAGIVAWSVVNTADVAKLGVPRNGNHCGPNAMLYAKRTQTTSTEAKAYIAMNAELIAHFFLTMPP